MTIEVEDNVIDDLYEFGAKELGKTAKIFIDEAQRRGLTVPDAILLFVTLLISQALAVVKSMVPVDGTCDLIVEMVREQWDAMKEVPVSEAN